MINDFYNRNFPVLDLDDELILREQSPSDSTEFYEYYSNPNVNQYILASCPKSIADANAEINYCRNLFYYRRGLYWSIATKKDNRMIGALGLYVNNNHHRAEICYDLSQDFWRCGIMSKAITRVLKFTFSQMGVHRIEALTVRDNLPSMAILEKIGFIHEATLKNYRYFQNQPHDVEMFSITPALFQEKQKIMIENNDEIANKVY